MFCLKTLIFDNSVFDIIQSQRLLWKHELIEWKHQGNYRLTCSLHSGPNSRASPRQRNQTCTHTYIVLFFSPKMKHLHLNVTCECALLKQVVKSHSTHSYMIEVWTSRGKTRRVVRNNTVQKLEPLRASSSSQTSCTLDVAEQQTNRISCTLSLSSSPSFSRLVMTSTSACLVSQKNGDLWECFGKNKCWRG